MIWGYVWADPTELQTAMCTKLPATVMVFGVVKGINTDAGAYVETLQTIVVKPPWIDSVANGGRPPYVFQQASAPSHKALKRQNWMVENFHHHVTPHHTKLMGAS
ncbi:hypothetical protein ACTXT7_013209 [Hymenolepis weldensis]